jgi:hypothetical protein
MPEVLPEELRGGAPEEDFGPLPDELAADAGAEAGAMAGAEAGMMAEEEIAPGEQAPAPGATIMISHADYPEWAALQPGAQATVEIIANDPETGQTEIALVQA